MAPEPNGQAHPLSATRRIQIHAAFDRVALSLSCSLASLLRETRTRQIPDEAVRALLAGDEADARNGHTTDVQLLCYISNAGTIYITRDTAAHNEPLATKDAFTRQLAEKHDHAVT